MPHRRWRCSRAHSRAARFVIFSGVRFSTLFTRLAAASGVFAAHAQPVFAQSASACVPLTSMSAPSTPVRATFVARDWWILGAFGVGSAIAMPFDRRFALEFERPSSHSGRFIDEAANVIGDIGDPGAVTLSVASYAIGRLTHHATMADVGLHSAEAVIVSGAVNAVLKTLVGRARPYTSGAEYPFVFHPGGHGGYTAYASGHTTVAFAAASVLSAELSRSEFAVRHPDVARAATPGLFGIASLVGLTRMYHRAHWASDVVAAAGIGTVTGRVIVRTQHDRACADGRSRVDRWLLPSGVSLVNGGVGPVWSATFR